MPKHRVFYSFHYAQDNWRAAMVRNIGTIDGSEPAPGNDWETIKKGGDTAIEKWIATQMKNRSCTVVLVGAETAGRKWIKHEIIESWKSGMGVVGIRIHGLKNQDKKFSERGKNPFANIRYGNTNLSSIVKCYDPEGSNSQARYDWIKQHLANAVTEANNIRKDN